MLAVRRLLHHKPDDPKFGTYHTVQDADGNFQSTLRLIHRAQAAARLRKREYKGEVCGAVPRWKQSCQPPACFGMILKHRRKPQSCRLQRRCRGRRNAAQSAMQPAKCDGMALVWRVHRKGAESHRATCTFLIL